MGYFGSYARSDWGVGSDLDLVVILDAIAAPFEQRDLSLDLATIPVPVDVLIYSLQEWQALLDAGGKFIQTLQAEAVWVYENTSFNSPPAAPERSSG